MISRSSSHFLVKSVPGFFSLLDHPQVPTVRPFSAMLPGATSPMTLSYQRTSSISLASTPLKAMFAIWVPGANRAQKTRCSSCFLRMSSTLSSNNLLLVTFYDACRFLVIAHLKTWSWRHQKRLSFLAGLFSKPCRRLLWHCSNIDIA